MTTATDLRTLADRVEAVTCGEEEVYLALGYAPIPNPHSAASLIGRWYAPDGSWCDFIGVPRFFTSLDAAASIMPEGWCVRVEHLWPECLTPDRRWYADAVWPLVEPNWQPQQGHAATECAARVAAALRARAHMMEVG